MNSEIANSDQWTAFPALSLPTETDTRHEFFNSANPLVSMRYLKKIKSEVKIEEWESNLPSEMTIEALKEAVCDLRNGEIPDGNKQILKKYVNSFHAITGARALVVQLWVHCFEGDRLKRFMGLYQHLAERELVSRITGTQIPSGERKFLQLVDDEIKLASAESLNLPFNTTVVYDNIAVASV